ncbi:MAG: hypothetical protein FJX75_18550 [Armatimonadetes bacterium]|nr:hypothetical protein [Armatimonadota bacterium]
MRHHTVSYHELKDHLPAPARHVVEALMETDQALEDILRHLVYDEGCDLNEAYGYVREVLSRSLMELTGTGFRVPIDWGVVPAPVLVPA